MKRKKLDVKYIERMKNGDMDAFNTVFEFYKDSIYYFSLSYVKNTADAEEIVQETFIQVLKNIHKLSKLQAFSSWIHKIAYHIAMDSYRRKGNKHIQLDEEYDIEELLIQKKGPREMLDNKEIVNIVETEIEKMPPKLLRVAQLRYFDDYTTKEIADLIEIPEGTVKSRLNRIRKIIQPVLEGHGVKPSRHFSVAFAPIMAQVMASTIAGHSLPDEAKVPMKDAILAQAQTEWQDNIGLEEETKVGLPAKWKAGIALATGGAASVIGIHSLTSTDDSGGDGISHVEEIHIPERTVNHPFEVEVVMDHDVEEEEVHVVHNNKEEEFVVDHNTVVFEAEENGEYTIIVDDVKSVIRVTDVIDMEPPEFTGISHVENGIIIEAIDYISGIDYEMSYITYNDKTYYMDETGFVEGEFKEGIIHIYLYDQTGNNEKYTHNLQVM